MSQENVELHSRSIDAVNRRDQEAFLALMDTDVEVVSRIVAVEGASMGMTESGLGGPTGSRLFPTTRSASSGFATWEM